MVSIRSQLNEGVREFDGFRSFQVSSKDLFIFRNSSVTSYVRHSIAPTQLLLEEIRKVTITLTSTQTRLL